MKRGRRNGVQLKVSSCSTLNFMAGETKAQLRSHVPESQGIWDWVTRGWGLRLPTQCSLCLGSLTGRNSWPLLGFLCVSWAALLSHYFPFWKQAFLFYLEPLILNRPYLSFFSWFYFNNSVQHSDINQVEFSLIVTKEFLLFSPFAPRKLITIVPQTCRPQGGWPPGQLWLWSRRGLREGHARPREE